MQVVYAGLCELVGPTASVTRKESMIGDAYIAWRVFHGEKQSSLGETNEMDTPFDISSWVQSVIAPLDLVIGDALPSTLSGVEVRYCSA
eukprot:scaffold12860_cov54-Attheya_sp.AAC.4